ncbi:histidine ammonia-lyase [Niabella ginsenosidivorans]|uniref:Histidine ammonia-lyase n=1 Tax=Niabella ginsenosidivorans TaxID=1176587 RepID=A0A1A9I0W9_9BACT|nr:histidine ammonia-lyase [Niabella ginsenosidivorans]ANH80204.1 histidine ammonia-lyase [Niabella ginsenosidivorans]
MSKQVFRYGEDFLKVSVAMAIVSGAIKGILSEAGRERIRKSAAIVERVVTSGEVVYGINTGFGPLCTTPVNEEDTRQLQENILKSHAAGVGQPIDQRLSKLMLVLKVHSLAKGFSGICEATIDRIIWHIEQEVIPVVPEQGSVGASGDLAPLSHLFLPLIGLGKVFYKDAVKPAAEVLRELGMAPLQLEAKEGLALINGTQFIAAHAVTGIVGFHKVLTQADLNAVLMLEGLSASIKPFYPELHALRPFKGNQFVASTIYNLLKDSAIVHAHANCSRVQDPYSLRCVPQVHGASRNAWLHLKELVETEINSVTDNPLLINERLTISGGNFHGQPLAMALDYACLAAAEIGNIADRRVYLSLEGDTPGVPRLLLPSTGLNSGFMILQYTTAALASENKTLCFPSSADSIPTSLGQEDHVSMGSISGRKLLQVLGNVEKIQAIELICAAQALDFHAPLKPTPIVEAVHQAIRNQVPHIETDTVMTTHLEAAMELVGSGALIHTAKKTAEETGLSYMTELQELFDRY